MIAPGMFPGPGNGLDKVQALIEKSNECVSDCFKIKPVLNAHQGWINWIKKTL